MIIIYENLIVRNECETHVSFPIQTWNVGKIKRNKTKKGITHEFLTWEGNRVKPDNNNTTKNNVTTTKAF